MAHFPESEEEPKLSRIDIWYGEGKENTSYLCRSTVQEDLIQQGFTEQESDNVAFYDHHIEELSSPKAWSEDYGTLIIILDSEVLKYFQNTRNANISSLRTPCKTKYIIHLDNIEDLTGYNPDFRSWEDVSYYHDYRAGLDKIVQSTLKEYKPKTLNREGSLVGRNGMVKGCFDVTPNRFYIGCSHLLPRRDRTSEITGVLVINLSPIQWSFKFPPKAILEQTDKSTKTAIRLGEVILTELSPNSTYSFKLPQITPTDSDPGILKYMMKVTDVDGRSIGNRSCTIIHQNCLCYLYLFSEANISELTGIEISDQKTVLSDRENHELSCKLIKLLNEHELPLKLPKYFASQAMFPTMLHFACRYGLKDVIRHLNQKFPYEFHDFVMMNKEGKGPLDMVPEDDPEDIKPYLQKIYKNQDYYMDSSGIGDLMNGPMNGRIDADYASYATCTDKILDSEEESYICIDTNGRSLPACHDDDEDDEGLKYDRKDQELIHLKNRARKEMRLVATGTRSLDEGVKRIRELSARIDGRVQYLKNEWIESVYQRQHDPLHVSASEPVFEDSYTFDVNSNPRRKFSLPEGGKSGTFSSSTSVNPAENLGCYVEDNENDGADYENEDAIRQLSKNSTRVESPPPLFPRARTNKDIPSYPAPSKPTGKATPQPKPRTPKDGRYKQSSSPPSVSNQRKKSAPNDSTYSYTLPAQSVTDKGMISSGAKTLPSNTNRKQKPPAPPPQSDKPTANNSFTRTIAAPISPTIQPQQNPMAQELQAAFLKRMRVKDT